MKVKKIVALTVGAAMLGSVAGVGMVSAQKVSAPNGIPQLNIKNTQVVLPTIPEVNGIPLHIKDDAASAVLLVTDVYNDSVLMDVQAVQNALTPVEAGGQISNMVKDTDSQISIVTDVSGDGNPSTNDVDIDGHWYIPGVDMPLIAISGQYYDSSGNPLDVVGFAVDFSKVSYIEPASGTLSSIEKAHKGEWELKDGAIQIGWALQWSPLKPNPNDDVVLSQKTIDNQTINVIYYYKNFEPAQNPVQAALGTTQNVDNWKVKPLDIDVQQDKAILSVTGPNGTNILINVQIDETAPYHYVFWINGKGDLVHWSDDNLDQSKTLDIDGDGVNDITATDYQGVVQQLEKAGIGSILVIEPDSQFIGVNGTKNLEMKMSAKELKNTYQDGEKVVDIFPQLKNFPDYQNWYLKIDASNPNQPVVYFVWKSVYDPTANDYANYPPVFFKPGDKVYIPIPYFKNVGTQDKPDYELQTEVVALEMKAQLNATGTYYDPATAQFYVEYYKNFNKYYDKNTTDQKLEELMNEIQAIDPTQALITDQALDQNGFQAGKDYVIIGGWVSNAAWETLEKYYPQQVAEMKQYLLDEINQGKADYVVYVLPNPADSNHVIIVAAGTDHEQTAKAVQYIIQNMGQ